MEEVRTESVLLPADVDELAWCQTSVVCIQNVGPMETISIILWRNEYYNLPRYSEAVVSGEHEHHLDELGNTWQQAALDIHQ